MNMKLIVMALGAFVIGLGGSTAAIFMTAPAKAAPVAPATAAHSGAVPHGAGASDSIAHASTTPATTAAQPPAAATIAQAAPGADVAHAQPSMTDMAATASLASTESTAGYRQVGRVLSSMKPADAAKIAAYLTDDQVEGILGQLGVRQAASLLTELPTERAAALSRRIMKHTEAK